MLKGPWAAARGAIATLTELVAPPRPPATSEEFVGYLRTFRLTGTEPVQRWRFSEIFLADPRVRHEAALLVASLFDRGEKARDLDRACRYIWDAASAALTYEVSRDLEPIATQARRAAKRLVVLSDMERGSQSSIHLPGARRALQSAFPDLVKFEISPIE